MSMKKLTKYLTIPLLAGTILASSCTDSELNIEQVDSKAEKAENTANEIKEIDRE
jgi:capsular polysaccharide biosynthesis protein